MERIGAGEGSAAADARWTDWAVRTGEAGMSNVSGVVEITDIDDDDDDGEINTGGVADPASDNSLTGMLEDKKRGGVGGAGVVVPVGLFVDVRGA